VRPAARAGARDVLYAGPMDAEPAGSALPRAPIHRLLGPLERFLRVEAAGGVVLLACALAALLLANSPWSEEFAAIWRTELRVGLGGLELRHSLRHWINDGLMAVFFFVIGLEVKRELAVGELRDPRRAALPLAAALGGMVAPACVYLALQAGTPAARGWGIPMATDIAFVVGCLALLGPRVPLALRVFLLSLAIADDIGAIVVIAVGYTESLELRMLGLGLLGYGVIGLLTHLGVRSLLVYTAAALAIWLAFHASGVHATIAGVGLGLLTPVRPYVDAGRLESLARDANEALRREGDARERASRVRSVAYAARETVSPGEYLENLLHPWVGFGVMPLFALANAGVAVDLRDFGHPVALAVAAGLVLGKPIGILGASWLAVRSGVAALPSGVGWAALAGAGALGGIGFTMALFIAGLALEGALLDAAKIGTLSGSVLSAALGLALLRRHLPAPGGRDARPGASRTGAEPAPGAAAAGLQHGEAARRRAEREGALDPVEVLGAKAQASGAGVLRGVRRAPRLRDGEERCAARQEGERDLPRRRAVRRGHVRERAAARAARSGKAADTEGRVADDRDAVPLAPREYGVLDAALAQVVEHLVADGAPRRREAARLLEVRDVEVADAPGADLPVALEPLERLDRRLERDRAAPVEEVDVEPIGPQPRERALARRDRTAARCVLGEDLRDEEHVVAASCDRLPDPRLRLAVAVHLRGVDVRRAEVEPAPQRRDRRGALAELEVPGALADDRHRARERAEGAPLHVTPHAAPARLAGARAPRGALRLAGGAKRSPSRSRARGESAAHRWATLSVWQHEPARRVLVLPRSAGRAARPPSTWRRSRFGAASRCPTRRASACASSSRAA